MPLGRGLLEVLQAVPRRIRVAGRGPRRTRVTPAEADREPTLEAMFAYQDEVARDLPRQGRGGRHADGRAGRACGTDETGTG